MFVYNQIAKCTAPTVYICVYMHGILCIHVLCVLCMRMYLHANVARRIPDLKNLICSIVYVCAIVDVSWHHNYCNAIMLKNISSDILSLGCWGFCCRGIFCAEEQMSR